MSQNSIKILKNQSWWKRKKYILLLPLILIALALVLFCGLFAYYLSSENRDSFQLESESRTHSDAQDNVQDLQGVELNKQNESSTNTFDKIFNQDESQYTELANEVESSNHSSVTNTPVLPIPHSPTTQTNNITKIEIPKKIVPRNTKIPVVTQSVFTNDKKIAIAHPPQLNQPFKIDSIDAIILLELDMPVLQQTQQNSANR